MICPSNPRDSAYKRNYRCLTWCVLLISLLATNAQAFSISKFQKSSSSSPSSSPLTANRRNGATRLPLVPDKGNNNNNFHNNNNNNNQHGPNRLGVSSTMPEVMATSAAATAASPIAAKLQQLCNFCADRAPGVAISVALAQLSVAVGKTALGTHVSPLLWATIFGMAYGNLLHTPQAKSTLKDGIKFAKGRLLRLGIILYGFKITLQQIAGIGMAGLMTDIVMVASTLALGIGLGTKVFKLDEATSTLIGSGAAICGCSAVLATQPVVGGESHQVSAAVGTVVVGGTLSMFLYPFLFKIIPFLAASPKLMGIYTGSTIHEIAGVVAAGNAMGGDVAFTAVVTKLTRVLLLAPALTTLSWWKNRQCVADQRRDCKLVLPWFAFGFVAVSAMNSVVSFPTALVKLASKTSAFSLVCAMAALGIDSDFKAIRQLGSRPLLLAGLLWTWLAVGGLGIARLFLGV